VGLVTRPEQGVQPDHSSAWRYRPTGRQRNLNLGAGGDKGANALKEPGLPYVTYRPLPRCVTCVY
jgi:hypothetical protein